MCAPKVIRFNPDSYLSTHSVRSNGFTTAAWVWPRRPKESGTVRNAQRPWRGEEADTNKSRIDRRLHLGQPPKMTAPFIWDSPAKSVHVTLPCNQTVCERCDNVVGVCDCVSDPRMGVLAGNSQAHTALQIIFVLCLHLSLWRGARCFWEACVF